MKSIKEMADKIWSKFSDATKAKIISIFNTAMAAFGLTILVTLATGEIEWSLSFFLGVVGAGFREAVKAIVNIYVPERLGGYKKL